MGISWEWDWENGDFELGICGNGYFGAQFLFFREVFLIL